MAEKDLLYLEDRSYVKIYRSLTEWRLFHNKNALTLFITILLKANWKEKKWDGMVIESGEMVTSIKHLCELTNLTESKVRLLLKKMDGEEITIKTTNRFTLIKLNKWAYYQGDSFENDNQNHKQMTIKTHSKRKRNTTTKEREEGEERIERQNLIALDDFDRALLDFEEMRKKIRKPLTDSAKKMILKKLESMTTDRVEQIEILNQSTMNCWQGLFPLNKNGDVDDKEVNLFV
ncbi:MAG: hypothetical protein PUD22_06795 [Erysipelotrichaceae bacterium]|nr:hypothetical protein [Erysipelotrichaceae bacterium]